MKIGFDIDNVVSEFDEIILKNMLKEDRKKRNKGIINPDADYLTHGMFDWSKEETDIFFNSNTENFAKKLKTKPYAKKIINQLLEEGNEVYFISHRAYPHYNQPFETTKKWFDKKGIKYTQIVISKNIDKSEECKNLNLDIMFDDTISGCLAMLKNKINCIAVMTKYNKNSLKNLEYVTNWLEIYDKIKSMEKVKVIFDTDLANETDDKFALSYLLHSLEKFDLEAITLAPFIHRNEIGILSLADNQEKNFQSAKEILKLCKMSKFKNLVFKGSNHYFDDAKSTTCDAVEKIIETARKNKSTTILAIGAPTNLALAIKKAPDIKNKIKIVWLGGNSFLYDENQEYNFRQDKSAVRTIFNSKVDLTVIPCRNVSSNLMTTKEELEYHLNKSKLGQYLIKGFLDFCQKKNFALPCHELFDISVVAYMLNKSWFKEKTISCPKILKDGKFKQTKFRHKVKFIYDLQRDKIFFDLFKKIGEI